MMKYATVLRLGTAETEVIMKRSTRNNLKHPTYQVLGELGKTVKTILRSSLEGKEFSGYFKAGDH